MANFDTSNLLTAQTILARKYAAAEMRMKPCPTFELLTNNSNFLVESAEVLRTREDRPIEAHLFARTKRASTSTRTHNHAGTIDDTAKVTLAWTSKVDKTAISLKLLDKSVFDFDTALANKLEQCCMNILEDKETEAIAYLRANRATQQPTIKGGTFNAANDAVEISADDVAAKQFFARVKSIMRQNYFNQRLDIVADSNMIVTAEFLAAQGGGNATNTGYQFGNLNIVESVELSDANYDAVGMVMPGGSVAALNWIPKQNRTGHGDYNSYLGGYGSFRFMGYTFALHAYAERADTSATNGNEQDNLLQFELSLDSSYNRAPLSYTTGRTDSVIVEFAQLT
jgi:hypothetical protein